jgi:hypothetical protein
LKEKILIGLVSALIGGAGNSALEGRYTSGRLEAIEKAVQRMEQRLDALTTPPKGLQP